MKAIIMAITLAMLSACGLSLPQHALIAVTASDALGAVGDEINREMAADSEAIGGPSAPEEKKAALDAHWNPVIAGYALAAEALDAYAEGISAADKAGDKSLVQAPARALVNAWVEVDAIAEKLGLALPNPPDKLVKFVESGP